MSLIADPLQHGTPRHDEVESLRSRCAAQEHALQALHACVEEQATTIWQLSAEAEDARSIRAILLEAGGAWHAPVSDDSTARSTLERLRKLVYPRLVRRTREMVEASTPPDARVLVVTGGDAEFLELRGRTGSHFPPRAEGEHGDSPPPGSLAAIIQLEALRAGGAGFLVVPKPASGWLDHCEKFKQHLDARYCVRAREDDTCVIYALHDPERPSYAWAELQEIVVAHETRLGRPLSILDWNTGLDLEARLEANGVFQPTVAAFATLPYLERSVDFVALSSEDPQQLDEARRVADLAVLKFVAGAQPGDVPSMTVEWRTTPDRQGFPSVSIIVPVTKSVTAGWLNDLCRTLPRGIDTEIVLVSGGLHGIPPLHDPEHAVRQTVMKTVRASGDDATLCNEGVRVASGSILVFVACEAVLLPGWLHWVLRTIANRAGVGAVCGKVAYPDGRLKEAGCILLSDGSMVMVGNGESDLDRADCNHVRDTDCSTGLFIATPASIFRMSGGLPTEYSALAYAFADYCSALRRNNARLVYQPEIVLIDVTSDEPDEAELRENRHRFAKRWVE